VSGTEAGVPELVFFRVKLMLLEPAGAGMGSRSHIQAVIPVSIAGVFCHKAFVFREFVIELDHVQMERTAFEMAGAPPAMGIHRLESEELENQIKRRYTRKSAPKSSGTTFVKKTERISTKNSKDIFRFWSDRRLSGFQGLARLDCIPAPHGFANGMGKLLYNIPMTWYIAALLSAVFAALTSILAKIGIKDINSNLAPPSGQA
jgi:hypothetical protein